jgi:hypothetical protein
MDPVITTTNRFNRWLTCFACDWSGDTCELYAKMCNVSIPEAIERASALSLVSFPAEELSSDNIQRYIKNFVDPRNFAKGHWKALQNAILEKPSAALLKLIQDNHLWSGWRIGRQNLLTKIVGGDLRNPICKRFKDKALLPQSWGAALVLNFQDVPGRSVGFGLFNNGDEPMIMHKLGEVGAGKGGEGGLAMLDCIRPHQEYVYATSDPTLAMLMHRKRFYEEDEPLPLVLYTDDTALAWQSVNADNVIFWNRGLSWKTFDQARRVPRSKITTKPNQYADAENPQRYMASVSLNYLTDIMQKHAQDWRIVLCEWLTDGRLSESEIKEAVANLAFTPQEKEDIRAACPRSLRERVEHFLCDSRAVKSMSYGRGVVLERDNAWYFMSKESNAEELLSDAVIKIHKEINDTAQLVTHWEGEIHFKRNKIPFTAPVTEIEADPEAFLRRKISEAGLGMPITMSKWRGSFAYLAKSFSTPQVMTTTSSIGATPDGVIHFQKFTIQEGEIVPNQYVCNIGVPTSTVPIPEKRGVRPSDIVSPVRSAWAALAACYIYNLLAPLRDMPNIPVAAAGSYGSCARVAVNHLAKTSGMDCVILKSGHVAEMSAVHAKLNKHTYPIYLSTQSGFLLGQFDASNAPYVFLGCETWEAMPLAVGSPWLIVSAPQPRVCTQPLPGFDDIAFYLAHHQKKGWPKQDPGSHPVQLILKDFITWYSSYIKKDMMELYEPAKKMLRVPVCYGFSLLEMCQNLRRLGKVMVTNNEVKYFLASILNGTNNKFAFCIDIKNNLVAIDRGVIQTALSSNKYPVPDFNNATETFISKGWSIDTPDFNGWVIKKECWDMVIRGDVPPDYNTLETY